ncbi:MAG: hypothetical protein QNJ60_12740 [Xenococcaceae cyanobacterium MO_188.B19]|nr:hypothetical protein [Xenococcaceae cyanobacterium MO_188.B19]
MNWKLFWRKVLSLPQTYFLIGGAVLGYSSLVLWLGNRPLILIIGIAIAGAMIFAWFWKLSQFFAFSGANLLDSAIFLGELTRIERKLGGHTDGDWEQTCIFAQEIQTFAQSIASRESILISELLETLYTVLSLCEQVVASLVALEKMQTETYRNLTLQHLQTSCRRIQETHRLMQQLQDRILLSSLDTSGVKTSLPSSLRLIITENKTVLEQVQQNSSSSQGG